MTNDEKILSERATALVAHMENLPGCFLRPHRLHSGARGFRLLDEKVNPLGTYPYAMIAILVELRYLQPVKSGDYFIFTRTKKRLYAKDQIEKEKGVMGSKPQ